MNKRNLFSELREGLEGIRDGNLQLIIKNQGTRKWLLRSYTVEGGRVHPGHESISSLDPGDEIAVLTDDPGFRYEIYAK